MTQQNSNEPLRTETGELVNLSATKPEPTQTTSTTTTETGKDSQGQSTTVAPGSTAEGESLLTAKDKKKEGEKAQGAPEKYADFTLPEGVSIAPEQLTAAQALFKENGLTQEVAQKFVDFHVAQMKAAIDAPLKAVTDQREAWRAEVKADKDIGGKIPEVKATISKALDGLGSELATAVRQAMDFTGAGDNPAIIKALFKLAQKVTEGSHVSGNGPSKLGQQAPGAKPATAAHAMYPNLA